MTNYVVSKIKDELEKINILTDVYKIENTSAQELNLQNYDIIGIAYPVHSFNAPKIVIDFAKQLPKANKDKVFIISTAGDKSALNYASANLLMQILHNKQYVMPSNFIIKNDDKTVTKRLKAVCK